MAHPLTSCSTAFRIRSISIIAFILYVLNQKRALGNSTSTYLLFYSPLFSLYFVPPLLFSLSTQ